MGNSQSGVVPANLQTYSGILTLHSCLYTPRPAGVVLYSKRLARRHFLVLLASLLLISVNLRASTASDAIDTGVTLPENPFADAVEIVCIDEPIVWSLSGITTQSVSQCRGGLTDPFTGPVTPPAINRAMAAAALNFRSDFGDRSGLVIFARLAGFAALGKIGIAAFAAWVLSLVAWQIFDTQRYATRRPQTAGKRPAQPEAASSYARCLPAAYSYARCLPAAILRSTAAINRA